MMMMRLYQLSESFSLWRGLGFGDFFPTFFCSAQDGVCWKKVLPCVAAAVHFGWLVRGFFLVEKNQQQLPGASKNPHNSEGKSLRNHHLTKYLGE